MNRERWWMVLLIGLAAVVALTVVVAIGGNLVGLTRSEHVVFAYQGHLTAAPREIWRRLGWPDTVTYVRESLRGVRYEATPNDTSGRLVLLYAPDSFMVDATFRVSNPIVVVQRFAPEGGGTRVRVETWAQLRGGWHRLLLTGELDRTTKELIVEKSRLIGDPDPVITLFKPTPVVGTLKPRTSIP